MARSSDSRAVLDMQPVLHAVEAHPSLEAIASQLDQMHMRLARIEQLFALLPLLLAMAGIDPTHVPIEVAAIALGVSVPTIRRKIRRGELRLDLVAGTKRSGIPIADLYQLWTPIHVARAALARERSAMEGERGAHPKTRRAVGG